jgi:hypothetical protein
MCCAVNVRREEITEKHRNEAMAVVMVMNGESLVLKKCVK